MEDQVIHIVMGHVLEDLLQGVSLLLLLLYTGVQQGKVAAVGNRPIFGWRRRTGWQSLQILLRTFPIEVVQDSGEELTHAGGIVSFPGYVRTESQIGNNLDIHLLPD